MTDYFTDSGYEVRVEVDLSIKKQRLDILIIERELVKQLSELPDGLENLARYNLISYKSFRQTVDAWTLDELNGHYVNYRKQISPSWDKLVPVEDLRLYAVCTRPPEKLATEATLKFVKQGVYDIQWGGKQIRLIVLEGLTMPYTVEDYKREHRQELWEEFISGELFEHWEMEELLKKLPLEKLLKGLPPEILLKRLSREDIEAYLKKLSTAN